MVLVQWFGLSPDDASWEAWSEIAATYHLEDKVTFQGGGNDNNLAVVEENRALDSNMGRGKRMGQRPTYLKDYI